MNPVINSDLEQILKKEELFTPLDNKCVLVSGATGLVGSMLFRTLYTADQKYGLGMKLIGLIRNAKKAGEILGDLIESPGVELTDNYNVNCDYLIHTVSPTASRFFIEHPVETVRASVENTIAALETARRNCATMVYLSSMEQYGVPLKKGELMTEDRIGIIDHLNIRSSYSESKRLCECLCVSYAAEYDVNVIIARLAQTFGAGISPGDNRMPIQFAKAAFEGKNIILHTEGKSVSNFVYLTDAISGILTLMLKGSAGEAYNICNDGESRTVHQIADLVAKTITGGKIQVEIDLKEAQKYGYAPDVVMYLVSDRLKNLGWQPEVGMEEAYRRLIEYISAETIMDE